MRDGDRWPPPWWAVPLVALGAGVLVLVGAAVVTAFRAIDSVPAQGTPEGAVVDLVAAVDSGDAERVSSRLCSEESGVPDSDPAPTAAFFETHAVELAAPDSDGGRAVNQDRATTEILARNRDELDAPQKRWVVHLERPGIHRRGPMRRGPLPGRWLVCDVKATATASDQAGQ